MLIKKRSILLFFLLAQVYGADLSIDALIEQETQTIYSFHDEYSTLSHSYLSRGESYLLYEKYDLALEDLQQGYEIALACPEEEKQTLCLRSLFAQAIAYGNLGLTAELEACTTEIQEYLTYFKQQRLAQLFSGIDSEKEEDCAYVEECINRAKNAATLAKALIIKANPGIQFSLSLLIDAIEKEAIACCKSGGIWDACFKPILNKFYRFNSRWSFLRIPPDPAWDD